VKFFRVKQLALTYSVHFLSQYIFNIP
jgi:hypothetical protein